MSFGQNQSVHVSNVALNRSTATISDIVIIIFPPGVKSNKHILMVSGKKKVLYITETFRRYSFTSKESGRDQCNHQEKLLYHFPGSHLILHQKAF
jgi:hypothetical protein